jgi:hypothetical protein
MSILREPGTTPAGSRERTDLSQQYRPIGIGAVAAALSAIGKQNTGGGNFSPPATQERRYPESIAA